MKTDMGNRHLIHVGLGITVDHLGLKNRYNEPKSRISSKGLEFLRNNRQSALIQLEKVR